MPFKPPKASAFKQFVILDSEGVISALSAIDGGQIDEILTRSAEERSGEAGAELNIRAAKAGGKRSKGRKVEEEIRRARTRHATAAKLIEALHAHESIGVVDGALDMEVAEHVMPGMVLEFRGELRLHPLHQADQMLRSFIKVAPKFGQKEAVGQLQPVLEVWGALVGTDHADGRLLLEPHTGEPQLPRLLLPVPGDDFEVKLEDVLGEVTVIGQVERVLSDSDNYPAIRMLRGAPASALELGAVEEALPELVEGLRELDIPIETGDIFMTGPALILRCICAYR
jgi:hypothetical protein